MIFEEMVTVACAVITGICWVMYELIRDKKYFNYVDQKVGR